MDFKYRKFPTSPNNCPFPSQKYALRPVIQIDFDSPKGGFGYLVLIDSGADYCIFHAAIGEQIGIDIKKGRKLIFFGTSGEPQEAYFHKVSFKIGGNLHECEVGFSFDTGKLAYGLLGQYGFFNQWRIKFEYDKESVELKRM